MNDINHQDRLRLEQFNLSNEKDVIDNPDIEVYERYAKACQDITLVIWNKDKTKVLDEIAYVQDLFVMYRYIIASFGFDVSVEIVNVDDKAVSTFIEATSIENDVTDCAV